jgi:hypothetical protein
MKGGLFLLSVPGTIALEFRAVFQKGKDFVDKEY